MTKQEAIISSAYTMILFPGITFQDMAEYVERKLGRPVFTHEYPSLASEIKNAVREDFLALKGE